MTEYKQQIHYLNILKTALAYLKLNKNKISNGQLVKVYKKVKDAEYSDLDNKFRIDNNFTQDKFLGDVKGQYGKYTSNGSGISFASIGLNKSCGRTVLDTLWWGKGYRDSCYAYALKRDSLPKALRILKTKSIRELISSGAYLLGVLASIGLSCWLSFYIIFALVPLFLGLCVNFTDSDHRSQMKYNCHLTSVDELYEIINGIYRGYVEVIGNPADVIKSHKKIKQNHTTWHELHQKLEQSEVNALSKKNSKLKSLY